MRAIQVPRFGGPEVMRIVELPIPEPGPGEVLVRVRYAGVNYSDVYRRMGRVREGHAPDLVPPFIPGSEAAGEIAGVGRGVDDLAEGDRIVYSQMNVGASARYAVIPAWRAVRIPAQIPLETAAAAYMQGSTAYYLSHWVRPIQPSDTVLIQAGAGGVGQKLLQFAKMLGARVITTVGSDEKAAFVESLGADLAIRYRTEDFREATLAATDGRGVDVVYDGVGRDTILGSIRSLRRRGLCVLFGVASGPVDTVSTLDLAEAGSVFFTRPQLRHYLSGPDEIRRCADGLFGAVMRGQLRIFHRVFSLEHAADAHRTLESRQMLGKILLGVD
ncbi:MAG TPA: quinone oxidoreductase [Burkholderiaceae bacterium]|nr:quinone oxidoreductase [Burkholderiaceae bacterium]